MSLFLRACPAPVAGVTGTKGKTTTTTLLHAMLSERFPNAVLAGNMGRSALAELTTLDASSPVALEISSFQAEALDELGLSPHVTIITNISEDHLDRYASFDVYATVKARLGAHQRPDDWLVVPSDDERIGGLTAGFAGRHVTFGIDQSADNYALWIDGDRFAGRWAASDIDLGALDALRLPGPHSRMNALAAAAAALALGATPVDICAAIATFSGVPHRLEAVAEFAGVTWVNDTAATAPAAAIAALRAYTGRDLIVIAGGSEKRLSLDEFADALAQRARRVVLLDGAATPRLMELLARRGYGAVDGPVSSMEAAVEKARQGAHAGTLVLLSPGCASFGMFRDEFHRGEAFRQAVQALAAVRGVEERVR
jgi:UDP-N-acetylmuramoylalanine--D-glutamate ligase